MKLSIVIVSWNVSELLRVCLQSIFDNPPQHDFEVFVVDNSSHDHPDRVVKDFKVTYIPQIRNMGFAVANNVAIRKTTGDYVLLLNPDTVVGPGTLDSLILFAKQKPHAGIIGPKLLNPDGSLQPSVRKFPTTITLAVIFLKLHRIFPKIKVVREFLGEKFDYYGDHKVDQVMGACFLIRREVVRMVGLLDEHFFIWFEEVDYCKRAIRAGFEVWYTGQASITHYFAQSFRQQFGPLKQWRFCISALRYARTHLGNTSMVLLSILFPLSLLLSLFQLTYPTHVQGTAQS